MLNKDHVWIGMVFGLLVPFVAYGIILFIYDQLDAAGITDSSGMGQFYRERTVGLLAIAANIIPINIFKRRYQINNMRGVLIATMIYVVIWVIRYYAYIG
ncbi:MAG: hypothetical protein R3275_00955 [Saprospiraceae bacterium]|nr:hypothetical protein [Saprospiraceae bacterium]